MRVWIALCAQVAFAAAPAITELKPRGAEIGRPFTLTAIGRNLVEGAKITTTMPATFTPVIPKANMPGRMASFLVELKPDAAPGVYPVRVETPSGVSNILLFTLGTYPEVTEEESEAGALPNRNDTIETAEPVRSIPVVVNGTLRGPERDVFRVAAKAGERRVIEVEARRSGSAVDPVLRILDGNGKQLARSDDGPGAGLDPRIDFTFPADGSYYVEVADARFSNQAQNFYRLKMGSYKYAEGIFPLGGRKGEQTAVTFFGPRLGAGVQVTADLKNADGFTKVALPDSPALPFLFAVGEFPEMREPVAKAVALPVTINGRLDKAGEIDRYKLTVEPGDKLIVEMQARELGTSKLEAIVSVYDAAGKKLASAGDQPLTEDVFAVQASSRTSSDPFVNVTVPADCREVTVSVEDLALRGGPLYGYRLIARKQSEDFRLTVATPQVNIPAGGTALVTVSADRRGFDGPIQLTVANLPKGLKVEGGFIPREYLDASGARTFNRRGVLLLTAEHDTTIDAHELEVWGEGGGIKRRARGIGMSIDVAGATEQGVVDRQRSITAPWLGLELPVAIADTPSATLEVKQTAVKQMEEGARYEYAWTWTMRAKATAPMTVGVDVNGAKDLRIIDMKAEKMGGTFAITTTKATDPARYDLYINGRLRTDDGDEVVYSRPIAFEVTGGPLSAK
jgi:hypothetical protein